MNHQDSYKGKSLEIDVKRLEHVKWSQALAPKPKTYFYTLS